MSGLARAREGGCLYLPQLYLKEDLSSFRGEGVLEAIALMDFKSRFRGNWQKRRNSIQEIGVINWFLEVKILPSSFLAVREQQGQSALQGRGARSPGQCRAGRAAASPTIAGKQVESDESPVSTQQVLSSRAGPSQARDPSL